MVHIQRSTHCGNSPKNKKAEDLVIALESGDTTQLAEALDTKAIWHSESKTLSSAQDILTHLQAKSLPESVHIDIVMSHGKTGAVNGTRKKGSQSQGFCHLLEFTSATCKTIGRIVSYEHHAT